MSQFLKDNEQIESVKTAEQLKIYLSVSPAPPLVIVAPSDKQTELLTVLQWEQQCENLVP